MHAASCKATAMNRDPPDKAGKTSLEKELLEKVSGLTSNRYKPGMATVARLQAKWSYMLNFVASAGCCTD